jgi:signal transduction histidine kinase
VNQEERQPFLEESAGSAPVTGAAWAVLSVDDDEQVHAVTRLALGGVTFEERPLQVLCARSAAEAFELLAQRDDVSVILLDVVMETERSGLDLVRQLRQRPQLHAMRIIVRTGQPGMAPPVDVVSRYEIDGYCAKTDVTAEMLRVMVLAALRGARTLRELDRTHAESLAANRALQQANAELEQFASIAAHDLQSPLRSIVSYAQLLQRRHGDALGSGRELLDQVAELAAGLQRLVGDLLQFARIGEVPAERSAVALDEIVDGVRASLAPLLETRQATIEHAALPVVLGDRTQLSQLFHNLIDNGLKFQRDRRPRVAVSAHVAPAHWEIRVVDNGIGIERTHLGELFRMFKRLHSSNEFPGTGIGLAICDKVARRHGGSIRAESEPGVGTTMIVTLPRPRHPAGA